MELNLIHEELINEEGVNVADLPLEIRKKIKGFNLLHGRLMNNPENEKLFVTLQKQSISIADEVQNWIESDFDEEEEEEEEETPKTSNSNQNDDEDEDDEDEDDEDEDYEDDEDEEPRKNSATKQQKAQNKPVVENVSSNPKNFGNLLMEKKILAITDNNQGKITTEYLRNIIGKEPDYPTQVVNNLLLKKVFLSSNYKLA
jgi:hypothetical protein